MKLYHEVRGCSLAVDIVAREISVPLELEWVDMATKRLHDGTDYRSINSKGTVPTLELPDGRRLSEAVVIMQYLADEHGQGRLLPPCGTFARLRVLEWMSFVAADLHKGGFMPLFKKDTPAEYRRIAHRNVRTRLAWLDSCLAEREYLEGQAFSIADAHCYTIAAWTRIHGIDTAGWPGLERYLARIGSRPSVLAAEGAAREQDERAKRSGRPSMLARKAEKSAGDEMAGQPDDRHDRRL